ncbi:class I SAM-dependent methyltransferase [Actinospica sp. MGRD01-02]|uniref:Class I SAM-dependent methyltransferase n=1 Tax=Actinospica acidithermotolerans TaxID=2828514 RepID=A0A941IKJ0_9ACTN|nr:class I SAM-dependent methyltransferase [Actinospica acidithermotolerans]MBR7828163.1 class I SAM-dependent methyltransferase [Actinospica acidithermotolerans]
MPRDDAVVLFAGTSQAYATYRPGYPDALFDKMAAELAFNPRTRVADLGCGPGTASIPLARRAGAVLAIDPNTEMLQAARAATQRAGLANIEFRHGHAERLPDLDPGGIEHVVFGRSFHWTDRAAVVATLDTFLPAHGAIVLLGPGRSEKGAWHRWPWDEAVREVREAFLGPESRAGAGTYAQPEVGHEEVLGAGGFGRIERHSFTERVEYDLDHVLGLRRSYSHSAERLFGDRYDQYLDAVAAAVTSACGPGPYRIDKQDSMVIARRPTSS